jgi:SAM-dependent methyltransferase
MKLNLGCSDEQRAGYVGVDVVAPAWATEENFKLADLSGIEFVTLLTGSQRVALYDPRPWPWPDSSVDEIVAHDVFEHVWNIKYPGQLGIVWCMNEAHRILKPGGLLDLWVPCLPGVTPFCDPTHVQVWTADHRYYSDERWNNPQGERGRLGPAYGITALFQTLAWLDPIKNAQKHDKKRPFWDWNPIQYAADAPDRYKLFLKLEAVK